MKEASRSLRRSMKSICILKLEKRPKLQRNRAVDSHWFKSLLLFRNRWFSVMIHTGNKEEGRS